MSLLTWQEALQVSIADTTQISNTVSETAMAPDFNLPAKYWFPGRTLRVTMAGVMSNVVTTPGTLTIRSRLGGVGGTILAASSAIALNTTARTNASIWLQFLLTCRTNGFSATAGSMMVQGWANLGASASVVGRTDMIPDTGSAAVSSLDLVSATILSFTAQFSVATNPTNLTIRNAIYESLN